MSKKKNIPFIKNFKIIRWSIGLGFKYSKGHFILQILTDILLELRSLFYAYFFAQIIDEIIQLIGHEAISMK